MAGKVQRHREEALNSALAFALEELGLEAGPEAIQRDKRTPDVRIEFTRRQSSNRHWRVIECKIGQDQKSKDRAVQQAGQWLNDALCEAALALCYSPRLAEQTGNLFHRIREAKDLQVCVLEPDGTGGWQQSDWQSTDVRGLAKLAKEARMAGAAAIAADLTSGIDSVVSGFPRGMAERIAQEMGIPKPVNAAAIAALLLINTGMLHVSLQTGAKGSLGKQLDSAQDIHNLWRTKQASARSLLLKNWSQIRDVDFAPVVDPAISIVRLWRSGEDDGALIRALGVAADCMPALANAQLDYAGPVYHGLLESRYDGSFYTNTSTAVILANLAIPDTWCNWKDWRAVAQKRICDPACGTGTLLMASRLRLLELFHAAQAKSTGSSAARGSRALLKALVEDVLVGFDINAHAIHLAACMLTLAGRNLDYTNMRLHRIPHGFTSNPKTGGREVRCGSLELLVGNLSSLPNLGLGKVTYRQTGQGETEVEVHEAAEPNSMDLIIMNPPYTRNQIRNDQFSRREETAVRKREVTIAKQTPDPKHRAAIDNSALSTYFIPVADTLLKPQGRLAMVRAFAFCTAEASPEERELLVDRYNVECVITSHDNHNLAFSGNTNIHESLIVAQKRGEGERRKPTTFVTIHTNPVGTIDARHFADDMRNAMAGNKKRANIANWGTIRQVPHEALSHGYGWHYAAFLNHQLVDDWHEYFIKNPKLMPLGEAAEVGPHARRLSGTFERDLELSTAPANYHAVWLHDTNERTTMATKPDTVLLAKPGREDYADHLWSMRGKLLLGMRWRTDTVRTPAVLSSKATLASAFISVRPHDDDRRHTKAKALCAWLNSSAGILSMLARRTRSLSYPMYSLESLRQLEVPATGLRILAKAYDGESRQALQPIRLLREDQVRERLDDAVARCLPELADRLPKWREWISKEPSVHGRHSPTVRPAQTM